MSDSSLRDQANPRTSYGLWPAEMRPECSVLGLDDLLSDPDGETLFLPTETVPEDDRRPIVTRALRQAA